MAKIIQCTHYPVNTVDNVFFIKEIIKVINDKWMVVTTSNTEEAQHFGDEAQLVVDGLNSNATFIGDPLADDLDYTPPTLNVVTIL